MYIKQRQGASRTTNAPKEAICLPFHLQPRLAFCLCLPFLSCPVDNVCPPCLMLSLVSKIGFGGFSCIYIIQITGTCGTNIHNQWNFILKGQFQSPTHAKLKENVNARFILLHHFFFLELLSCVILYTMSLTFFFWYQVSRVNSFSHHQT